MRAGAYILASSALPKPWLWRRSRASVIRITSSALGLVQNIWCSDESARNRRTALIWNPHLSRREFIQIAVAAAAASGTIACSDRRSPCGYLRVDEARTLASICDRLIPPDADPGASWAHVVNFIDRQLCGPYRDWRAVYRKGIACVDEMARVQFGKGFAELADKRQDAILTALEKGQAPKNIWKEVDPTRFFEMVLRHTMQGFYGDPRHGGNRGRTSWKMVRLPYPQIRGRRVTA